MADERKVVTGTLLEMPRRTAGRAGAVLDDTERMKLAMSIMDYNQEFVRFTDDKSNSLLLVNSIILPVASTGALVGPLALAAAACAAVAVLLCLRVVVARLPQTMRRDLAKLVFFGHVRQRRTKAAYQEDFFRAGPRQIAESLAGQIYDLAGVVEQKLRAYRQAQLLTLVSAALWMASLAAPVLGRLGALS
ncbi:MAG: hypothetical protein DRI34_07620 [Deltaproteobacteria bacterium]|nr:MAG: hypothetical protein DRI34_07620 [Deltaproteobacteria bacterium]